MQVNGLPCDVKYTQIRKFIHAVFEEFAIFCCIIARAEPFNITDISLSVAIVCSIWIIQSWFFKIFRGE